ncbi:MAG: hypothetical protein CMLOHMNK_00099 [Steroidobacteraceae bacterium]|nr:hypothetical protein [Steroidobacteraceae bacterium]
MTNATISLGAELQRYLAEHSLREAPVLARLRQVTAALPQANMQIAPEQGQFMQLLVRLMGAKRCLEVGTFTGYSALAVALVLPGDGELVACDVSVEWTTIAREYWREAGVDARIDLRLAPALATLDDLLASVVARVSTSPSSMPTRRTMSRTTSAWSSCCARAGCSRSTTCCGMAMSPTPPSTTATRTPSAR